MGGSGNLALEKKRGRRNAERRTLVVRNALRTLRRGDFFVPGTVLPAQARASSPSRQAFAHPSPVPPSHLRQSPVLGSGGYPRPPGSTLARHGRGGRIRPVRVTPPRPSFRSVPLQ